MLIDELDVQELTQEPDFSGDAPPR
jgi:hypothetical protein